MLNNHPRIRIGLYLAGLALAASSAIVGYAVDTELGTAVMTSAGILTAAALGIAASNVNPPE